ncbi:MAG: 54S ribosomal protein L2 mitochondrial [Sclerophora amabilis]|nr:MAG: 54S ribosomal protein L2 mitochondrial [Sclerophora amabilis]
MRIPQSWASSRRILSQSNRPSISFPSPSSTTHHPLAGSALTILPTFNITSLRPASHKAQGAVNSAKNGPGKRLGAKKTGEQYVIPGNIIFRQRGTQWYPGDNVGMGRDHTIFAQQAGYVKYYADPRRHPKRKYIGVVFDRTEKLPRPVNAARKRRLGMVEVPMMVEGVQGSGTGGIQMDKTDRDLVMAGKGQDASTIRVQSVGTRRRKPDKVYNLRPGYSYREANWEIGRAAERAKVKVREYKPRDRFTAWRKAAARKSKNAEKRSMTRKGKGGGKKK